MKEAVFNCNVRPGLGTQDSACPPCKKIWSGELGPNGGDELNIIRAGRIARTRQIARIVFNDNWQELRRESLLRDLHQRIRDVRQGPDGLIYAITDEGKNSVLLRIEPITAP